jgi:hypothetical protein
MEEMKKLIPLAPVFSRSCPSFPINGGNFCFLPGAVDEGGWLLKGKWWEGAGSNESADDSVTTRFRAGKISLH